MKPSGLSGEGCVVAHYGVAVAVRLEGGQEGRVRVSGKTPLRVGDRVVVEASSLVRVAPAKGVLRRRDSHGRIRSVAANLDALGIVIAPRPESPEGFVDRGLVAARASGLDALIVVNKADLGEAAALHDAMEERYAGGARTLLVSASSSLGLDALGAWLGEGRRGVFVGTSGVGKSSLLNALLPELDLAVGEINDASGLGRHVTSTATLHRLPAGGELIDTPGFRDFGPVEVSPAELAAFFPGFEDALGRGCRFRNCLHRGEPECGVHDELEAGRISPARHAGYLSLLAELEAIGGQRQRG
ncbi:MAG: ribosome small subunit-dependent GTPase A [Myxococcota bacterium]|nr:ribosome small subunit-dependent GTPase A [Myxococcota bacterium]